MSKVTAKSYTLRKVNGQWLGQIVLTSDGMYASVTDWGNLSCLWRNFSGKFEDFLLGLNIDYFASNMYQGISYISYGKKIDQACQRYAEEILPALQEVLRKEKESCQRDKPTPTKLCNCSACVPDGDDKPILRDDYNDRNTLETTYY